MEYEMDTFTECGEVVHQAHISHDGEKLAVGWGKTPEAAQRAADRDFKNIMGQSSPGYAGAMMNEFEQFKLPLA